jgi:hypothetical protein
MPTRPIHGLTAMSASLPALAFAHEGHEHFFGLADHVWPFVFAAAVVAVTVRVVLKRRAASKSRRTPK